TGAPPRDDSEAGLCRDVRAGRPRSQESPHCKLQISFICLSFDGQEVYLMRRCLAIVFLSLLFCSTLAFAQDESQVLRLSVGFRTLKNNATLDDSQRQEVARLEERARAAASDKKYGEALRSYHHAMAVIRKQPWTPA